MKTSGIYALECTPTGEKYVGSAINIARRWERHRYELKKQRHHSWKLQRAWNKHGAESFRFIVLEEVPERASLISVEQQYIDDVLHQGKLLNVLIVAGSPLGTVQSPATKAKRAQTLKGHPVSEETKQKIRDKARGRKAAPETRERMKQTWARKREEGDTVSEATRQKRRVPIERVCLRRGEVICYTSIQAVREDGFLPSCVSNVLAGRHLTHRGYSWRYKTAPQKEV